MTRKYHKKSQKNTDYSQLAYNGIRQMLFSNEISAGQKLSYRRLAETLGMSLTPVIQALKRLEFQGLVRHEPNRGYVAESISLQEVREIYELRETIELSLLPATIEALDDQAVDSLRSVLDNNPSEDQHGFLNERILNDRSFHLTLASLSGRKIQLQTLTHLFDLLYIKYRGSLLFVASEHFVGSEHQTIFDAVVSRDCEQARKALQNHFAHVTRHVVEALGQILSDKDRFPYPI